MDGGSIKSLIMGISINNTASWLCKQKTWSWTHCIPPLLHGKVTWNRQLNCNQIPYNYVKPKTKLWNKPLHWELRYKYAIIQTDDKTDQLTSWVRVKKGIKRMGMNWTLSDIWLCNSEKRGMAKCSEWPYLNTTFWICWKLNLTGILCNWTTVQNFKTKH